MLYGCAPSITPTIGPAFWDSHRDRKTPCHAFFMTDNTVAVLGAGMVGVATALELQRRGMAVTLMLMLPVLFTFSGKERKAIPVVLFNALLFGFLISTAEKYLA